MPLLRGKELIDMLQQAKQTVPDSVFKSTQECVLVRRWQLHVGKSMSKLQKKGLFLYTVQLASCVLWSGALDSFIIPLSYPIVSLA